MNDDVKDGQEAQAHVTKVDGEVLRLVLHGGVDLVCKALEVQLLRVFLGRRSTGYLKSTAQIVCFTLTLKLTRL